MEFMLKSTIALTALFAGSFCSHYVHADDGIQDCASVSDLRSVKVGFRCSTAHPDLNDVRCASDTDPACSPPWPIISTIWERVEQPSFGEAWKANGWIWSDIIGTYSNKGRIRNGAVVDSPAAQACAKIGGQLPDKDTFLNIIHDYGAVLPNPAAAWTSTVLDPRSHGLFETHDAALVRADGWILAPVTDTHYVRCVTQAAF